MFCVPGLWARWSQHSAEHQRSSSRLLSVPSSTDCCKRQCSDGVGTASTCTATSSSSSTAAAAAAAAADWDGVQRRREMDHRRTLYHSVVSTQWTGSHSQCCYDDNDNDNDDDDWMQQQQTSTSLTLLIASIIRQHCPWHRGDLANCFACVQAIAWYTPGQATVAQFTHSAQKGMSYLPLSKSTYFTRAWQAIVKAISVNLT